MTAKFQPKDFLYKLETSNGIFELENDPSGWAEYATEWSMHEKYRGQSRKFVVSLTFVKEGYTILYDEYVRNGVNGKARMTILRLNRETYEYYTDFTGDIDFSQFSAMINKDYGYFECQIMDSGLPALIDNRASDIYEIPLTQNIDIKETFNAQANGTWSYAARFDVMGMVSGQWQLNSSDNISDQVKFIDFGGYGDVSIPNRFMEYDRNIGTGNFDSINVRFTFKGLYRYIYRPDIVRNKYRVVIMIRDGSTGAPIDRAILYNIGDYEADLIDSTVNYTFNLRQKLYVSLEIEAYDITLVERITIDLEGILTCDFWTAQLMVPFTVKAIKSLDALNTIIDRIAGKHVELTGPSLLSENLNSVYITSDDGIRELQNSVAKFSFDDIWQSLNYVEPICIFLSETQCYMCGFDELFSDTELLNVGVIDELIMEPAIDFLSNYVKVGNDGVSDNMPMSRFEFNTLNEFTLPITRINTIFDLQPKFRIDSFGINEIRYLYIHNNTATTSGENNVFMIKVDRTSNPLTPEIIPVSGNAIQVYRTGTFNVGLSPKRTLIKWQRWLASMLQQTSGIVSFTTSKKTEANLISQGLNEKSNFTVDLNSAYFDPIIYKIQTKVPYNLPELMAKAKGGYISCTYSGITYKGYPLSVREEPALKRVQEMRLLKKHE